MDADAMILMCPLCGSMYDRNQRVIERRFNAIYNLPVLFYPQVLGLALGMAPKELGLDMNRVKTSDLLSKLGV
jgi:heterodisulfide reductase subunit B